MTIKIIDVYDTDDLKMFLDNCGVSLQTFSYFDKRSFDVLNDHVLTLLIFDNDKPVGYGHLDKEGDVIWLGICVSEQSLNKGYGGIIMRELLSYADDNNLDIQLSVMKNNIVAYNLYKKFDFKQFKEDSDNVFLKRPCSV